MNPYQSPVSETVSKPRNHDYLLVCGAYLMGAIFLGAMTAVLYDAPYGHGLLRTSMLIVYPIVAVGLLQTSAWAIFRWLIPVLLVAGIPATADAGHCYAPTYHAPAYYAPAYKYVVLYQIGVEQRVDAIAKKAAEYALANQPKPTANVAGKFTVEFGASSEASASGGGGVTTFGGARGTLATTEESCLKCHGGDAKAGDGKSFSSFQALNRDGAKAALRYVTKPTDSCATKAGLSAEATWELVEYLCKQINQPQQ